MAYNRIISGAYMDTDKDLKKVIQFLVEQFAAVRHKHAYFDNLVQLDGKIWWIVASTDREELDILRGKDCDKCELIHELNRLHSGLLIFRQLVDNRIVIYMINDMEKLDRHCGNSLIFNWETIEKIKQSSEMGIVVDKEVIGFRNLRRSIASVSKLEPETL